MMSQVAALQGTRSANMTGNHSLTEQYFCLHGLGNQAFVGCSDPPAAAGPSGEGERAA